MISLWPNSSPMPGRYPYQVLFEQAEAFNHSCDYDSLYASSVGDPTSNEAVLIIGNRRKTELEFLKITGASDYPCKVWWDGSARQALTQARLIGILAEIFHSQKASDLLHDFNA